VAFLLTKIGKPMLIVFYQSEHKTNFGTIEQRGVLHEAK
jgi:hypothetical protein